VEHSARHTIIFTTLLCVGFSVLVSSVAVGLRDRQIENQRLDRIRNVLAVAGLAEPGASLSPAELNSRFDSGLEAQLVELASGQQVEGVDALAYDQRRAAKDADRSRPAPDNRAKVRRIPNRALVYRIKDGDELTGVVLPIEGYGLWSTLYGYLALEADTRTVKGITFYEHGETPGLGGEVDNLRWKALWPGRKAFDESWRPMLEVKKGRAGSVAEDPYRVDGLSGATITTNGVSNMIQFWLSEDGFAPYLAQVRNEGALK
jgi:Na+-transporting NADH:ubiquinone oxidoreductase subunit C